MAYSVTPPAALQLSIVGQIDAQICMTILNWFLSASSPIVTDGATELNNFIDRVQAGGVNDIVAALRPILPTTYSLDYFRAQWIWPQRYQAVQRAIGLNGTAVTATDLPMCSAVVTRNGDLARKGRRSNLHLPAVPSTLMTAGGLTGAGINAYSVFGTQSMQTVTTSTGHTYLPIILKRSDPINSIIITQQHPMNSVRTMRRRVLGRGI